MLVPPSPRTGRTSHFLRGGVLVFALAVLFPAAGVVLTAPTSAAAPLALTLEASLSNGSAPLLVEFQASTVTPDPSTFAWTFGDGGYWNSSGSNSSSISHLYESAGLFHARVIATQGNQAANASLAVTVWAVPLGVTAGATPTSGPAPLTVTFSGHPRGGSGTYPSFVWNFGDGGQGTGPSIQYTYLRAGTFQASLLLTDSLNHNATTSLGIVVGPTPPPVTTNSLVSNASWGYLLGATVVVVAGVVAVAWSRRLGSVPEAPAVSFGASSTEVGSEELGGGAALVVPPEPLVAPGPEGNAKERRGPPPPAAPRPEALATRILLHLYGLGRLERDAVARMEWTQAGVSERLGIRQNASSRVLRSLVAAGVLEARTRHVRGRTRQVKVYTLTSAGERLALELRLARAKNATPGERASG